MFYDTKFRDLPNVGSLKEFGVSSKQLPAKFTNACKKNHRLLSSSGFEAVKIYYFPKTEWPARVLILYRHKSGKILVSCQYIEDEFQGTREVLSTLSALQDGTFAVTVNSDEEQFPSESVRIAQFIGADLKTLLSRHQSKFHLKIAAAIESSGDCEQIFQVFHQTQIEELIANEVFSQNDKVRNPLSNRNPYEGAQDIANEPGVVDEPDISDQASITEELVTSETASAAAPASTGSGLVLNENQRQVLTAIREIQNNQSGAFGNLILLLVSVALFVTLGGLAWDWTFVLLLIPILFVHELGHFVAMKMFSYKNVKMFFIPFFGAAVSGRKTGVQGWKKTLVSLAGPLPSLYLSIPLAIAGFWLNNEMFQHAILLTIVLNLFNLLPFLPLDGGWVMHSLYFCRTPLLDTVFRVLASLGLIGLSVLLGTRFLAYFGGFMLLGVPAHWNNNKIASRLRERDLDLDNSNSDEIPIETAAQIIDEMPKSGAVQKNPAAQAALVLQLYELITTKPPKAIATIGLTLLYLSGWAAGVVAFFSLGIGHLAQKGMFNAPQMFSTNVVNVSKDDIQKTGSLTPQTSLEQLDGFVAEFESAELARQFYESLQNGKPFLLIDRILIGTEDSLLTDERDSELLKAEYFSQNFATFFDSGCVFSISCSVPDEQTKTKMEQSLNLYSRYGSTSWLIPPWDPSRKLTDQQSLNRRTFLKIVETEDAIYESDAYKLLTDKQNEQFESAENIEVESKKINAEFRKALQELKIRTAESLLENPELQRAIVEGYVQHAKSQSNDFGSEEDFEKSHQKAVQWQLQIGKLLGQLPLDESTQQPAIIDNRFGITFCSFEFDELTLNFEQIGFLVAAEGLDAVLKWLSENGCNEINMRAVSPMVLFQEKFDGIGKGEFD